MKCKEEVLPCEAVEALEQTVQRSSGIDQGQVGWGFEQLGLVEDDSACGRAIEIR